LFEAELSKISKVEKHKKSKKSVKDIIREKGLKVKKQKRKEPK